MVNGEEKKHMVLYRGSLKSCNYHCSYCPFSKRQMSPRELEKDREQWDAFVQSLMEKGGVLGIGALMIVPYGEAMIHPWYWEGLARISTLSFVDAAGAQTNLSFDVEKALEGFQKAGGRTDKLRLWATFHPEMANLREFVQKCKILIGLGVEVSAGAVGVPQNLETLHLLRRELPVEIYLWVNKMDGLGRLYTQEEKEGFLRIDPYFLRELVPVPADISQCRGRLFVEGNGRLRICNIGPLLEEGWEDICRKAGEKNDGLLSGFHGTIWEKGEKDIFPSPKCGRKRCSCYLAYGGRENDWNRLLFGKYPLYRIPQRPKAVFLDIEGTLLPDAGLDRNPVTGGGLKQSARNLQRTVPAMILAGLEGLYREGIPLFFATTLPLKDARKRCRKIWHLFNGGIFAGGACLLMKKKEADGAEAKAGRKEDGWQKEIFCYLDETVLNKLELLKQKFFFRILAIRNGEKIYKITLLRPCRKAWKEQEAEELFMALGEEVGHGIRYFTEENCLQIVAKKATKENGVRLFCQWMNITPKETFAIGDSKEDEEMMRLCHALSDPAERGGTPPID